MTQTEIEEYITQFPIYQYAFVKPEDIEFNDRVRQICKKECSRYGASWSCPPAVGTVEVCKERCMNYDHVLFFSSIAEVDNIMDMDETLKTKSEHEKITREIEQHLKPCSPSPFPPIPASSVINVPTREAAAAILN